MQRNIFLVALAAALALAGANSPATAAASHAPREHQPLDCPLASAPYSVDSPLLDILLSPAALAALRSEPAFAAFLDHAQPMMLRTEAPSFAAIVSPRFRVGWAQASPAVLPALDARLRAVRITAVDRARRCARYDDDVPALAPSDGRPLVLVFEKMTGYRDDASVDAAHAALAALGERNGWSVVFTDKGGVMRSKLLRRFDVVVWNNVSGDVLTLSQRAAFRRYIEHGGGFVGIHGSGGDYATFWPWYIDELIGAPFLGHPMNPQFQDARITTSDWGRALAPQLPQSWTMRDEWYSFKTNPRREGTTVIATLDEASYRPGKEFAMGDDHPIAWTREPGKGRAFYSAIGHLPESYSNPQVVQLLEGALRWAGRISTSRH